MECGQYNKLWHQIHMYPEESVQASIDANANKVIPVHWAGFALAQHPWTEPVERFITAAEEQLISYSTPSPGAIISLDQPQKTKWWEFI